MTLTTNKTLNIDNLIIGYSKEYQSKIKLDVELKTKNNVKSWEDLNTLNNVIELSMSASVGNSMGGQCLDSIKELALKNDIKYKNGMTKEKLIELIEIWEQYHLNDMQAMSKRQHELFEKHGQDELFLNMCKLEEQKKKATCSYSDFSDYDKMKLFFNIYDMQNMEARKTLEARKKELETIVNLCPYEALKGRNEEHITDSKIDLSFLNIEFKAIVVNKTYGHMAKSTIRFYNSKTFGANRKYIYKYERVNILNEIEAINNRLNNDVNLYSYGSAWLFVVIPDEVINRVHELVNNLSNDVELVNEVINEDFTSKLNYDIVNEGLTVNKSWGNQSVIKYKVTLKYNSKQYTFSFYTGTAHAHPTIQDILQCLQSDCTLLDSYIDMDDFATNMGIEKPSEAVKQWEAINKQHDKLVNLFGDDFETFLNSDIS